MTKKIAMGRLIPAFEDDQGYVSSNIAFSLPVAVFVSRDLP